MALEDVYQYFRRYDQNIYEVMAQMGSEPTLEDVARFESRIGFRFPDEFREFAVHPLGGLCMSVKEEIWPRPEPFDVGPFWSFCYGFHVYGLSTAAPEWLQMGKAWEEMSEQGSPEYVPFLKIATDDEPYCFTADRGIVLWRPDAGEPERITESFSEVLLAEIHALEQRKDQKLKQRQQG